MNNWIPIEEKLPDFNKRVLLALDCKVNNVIIGHLSIIDHSGPIFNKDFFSYALLDYERTYHKVLAWQELPKEYKNK